MHDLKAAIQESSSTLIVLPSDASDTDYLASLQLQKIAPEKMTVIAPAEKEVTWRTILGLSPQKKEFAITVDTTRTPAEELRYEKEGSTLTIFLSYQGFFDREAISIHEYIPAADLFITLGFTDRDNAEKAIEELPHKGVARHIWIPARETTPISFEQEPQPKERLTQTATALLGRLMVRSREDKEFDTLWSFITKDDFVKTNAHPTEIPGLMKSFSHITSLPRAAAIFWQYGEEQQTHGILWSDDESFIQSAARELLKNPDNHLYVSLGTFANFIEAEMATRKLLRALGRGTILS